mmetsp:Transcript_9039/g.27191  ORF Transcript_9039/g.27191 Transcript_9039/m.27191 type:complete len:153 (-) Transcript_9039:15-473(-)
MARLIRATVATACVSAALANKKRIHHALMIWRIAGVRVDVAWVAAGRGERTNERTRPSSSPATTRPLQVGWCLAAIALCVGMGCIYYRKKAAAIHDDGADRGAASPPTTVTVVVPDNALPGEKATFVIADGRTIEAVIPPGVARGERFRVRV